MPSVCLEPDSWYDRSSPKGLFRSVCKIPGNLLKEGYYFVGIIIGNLAGVLDHRAHVYNDQFLSFEIVDKRGINRERSNTLVGVIQPRLDWKTDYQEKSKFPFKNLN